jgi:hypothetical protein
METKKCLLVGQRENETELEYMNRMADLEDEYPIAICNPHLGLQGISAHQIGEVIVALRTLEAAKTDAKPAK